MERTHTGAGEKCEKEGAAERNCYILTVIWIPHPPGNAQWRRERSQN